MSGCCFLNCGYSVRPALDGDQRARKIRAERPRAGTSEEVVGTVHNLEMLEVVVALGAAGVDKGDIDLMASREAVLAKLPAIYGDPINLAEIPDLPRRELVTRDEGATVTGVVFGTLISLAALGAALPVVASGGALAAVLAATAAGGTIGAGIAKVVRRAILGGVGADTLERDIRSGGLVVFVRVRDDTPNPRFRTSCENPAR
jgi:hypothetical protein